LTATALKNAKPRVKPYQLTDEKGLFVTVSPSGEGPRGFNWVRQLMRMPPQYIFTKMP
jgi:hypothetical protein